MANAQTPVDEPLASESSPREHLREYTAERYERMEACVGRNPTAAILVSFGAGMGLGLLLSSILVESPRRRLPPAHAAERLGRQMLDAIASVLPESFTEKS